MSVTTQDYPADLVQSLEKKNAAFTTLLSLIPAQYYIAPDPDVMDSKWMKNKKRKTGEEIKESKKKAKQAKLDPTKNLTAAEIMAQSNNDEDEADEEGSGETSTANGALNPLPPTASISELRAKLQARLQGFRRYRGANPGEEETGADGSVSSRDALEDERRKKRGEMRDRRRNERKEERRKERDVKAEKTEKREKSKSGPEEFRAKPAKTQLIVPQLRDDDSVSFPAISLPSAKSGNKSGTALKKLSNPSQALAQLEKHKARLASMPEDKRKEIEEKERWAKAEERASGGKVADSEKILKSAVKRKEKTKAKSSKEWVERKREIEKNQSIAIKKRTDNVAKRIQEKRDKKSGVKDKGKAPKKGRPGFEGKKKGGKK